LKRKHDKKGKIGARSANLESKQCGKARQVERGGMRRKQVDTDTHHRSVNSITISRLRCYPTC